MFTLIRTSKLNELKARRERLEKIVHRFHNDYWLTEFYWITEPFREYVNGNGKSIEETREIIREGFKEHHGKEITRLKEENAKLRSDNYTLIKLIEQKILDRKEHMDSQKN